jgi:hypothetical protein
LQGRKHHIVNLFESKVLVRIKRRYRALATYLADCHPVLVGVTAAQLVLMVCVRCTSCIENVATRLKSVDNHWSLGFTSRNPHNAHSTRSSTGQVDLGGIEFVNLHDIGSSGDNAIRANISMSVA